MLATNAPLIPKELIAGLRFPKQPVTLSDQQRASLQARLNEAMRLGNGEHGKCRITFSDEEGVKAVETTVWTYDADNIVLKYGLVIPVARVLSIEFP